VKLRLYKKWLLASLLVFAGSLSGAAENSPYYDEVFDTQGKPRPHYEEVLKVYSGLSAKQKKQFDANSFKDFKGDNALDPFPRLLPLSEYNELRRGVEQRGTALRMFLQEYYAGGSSWTQVIPKSTVERIISRSGESKFKGKLKPETISFPYGPDIIRTPKGGWAVIEDNPGYIGGIGDLGIAKDSLLQNMPEYKDAIPLVHNPDEYYQSIVARARARSVNEGQVVLLMRPPYPDFEDSRIAKHFHDLGVIPVTPMTGRKLVVKSDAVYLSTPSKTGALPKEERVGFVIMDSEHKWIDATHPAARETLRLAEIQGIVEDEDPKWTGKLRAALTPDPKTGMIDMKKVRAAGAEWQLDLAEFRRTGVPGLVTAMMDGTVATNYSPGVDFIGDKEFYTYVDELVRHYLKEEPTVTNLRTYRLAEVKPDGTTALNAKLMDEFFTKGQYKDFVFKTVDGRGGDGVWIGPKMSPAEAFEVAEKIRKSPESFIAQKYTHLSVIQPLRKKSFFRKPEEGRIVDLRLITDVGPNDIYVTRTPWGRGVPLGGNGKVNLSDRGREFMVGLVPDKSPPSAANCVRTHILTYLRRLLND